MADDQKTWWLWSPQVRTTKIFLLTEFFLPENSHLATFWWCVQRYWGKTWVVHRYSFATLCSVCLQISFFSTFLSHDEIIKIGIGFVNGRFVEIMAPVFSRDAWRCVWHMLQVFSIFISPIYFFFKWCFEKLPRWWEKKILKVLVFMIAEWLSPWMGSWFCT